MLLRTVSRRVAAFSIAALYSGWVARAKTLPALWLISDARNDAQLERALAALPPGSGFIYRHYHLAGPERLARFRALRRAARARGHIVVLADSALTAREWGADGIYGSPRALWPRRAGLLHLATAHDMAELGLAARLGADAALLSPVFSTRSHPGGGTLGPVRFRLLARQAGLPVIALGGMNRARARALQWSRWAAIDGLS
ncbi:MAG: thiamine phosphate synthase [Porphyrobacter sp.]|nr:thiamine phosphate synthase [Porphyrobacter sp.]